MIAQRQNIRAIQSKCVFLPPQHTAIRQFTAMRQVEKKSCHIHSAAHFDACFYSAPRLYNITSKSCVSLKLTIIFIISPSLSFWSVSSLCPGL